MKLNSTLVAALFAVAALSACKGNRGPKASANTAKPAQTAPQAPQASVAEPEEASIAAQVTGTSSVQVKDDKGECTLEFSKQSAKGQAKIASSVANLDDAQTALAKAEAPVAAQVEAVKLAFDTYKQDVLSWLQLIGKDECKNAKGDVIRSESTIANYDAVKAAVKSQLANVKLK